jgi:hypothetical protein
MPGWATMALADLAVAGDDVDHAGGRPASVADLGEQERGQRGVLGRLEDDGVAAGQRGRDLPGQHQQREVPGDDLAAPRPAARGPGNSGASSWPSRRGGRSGGDQRHVDVAVSRMGLPLSEVSSTANRRACFCTRRAERVEVARPAHAPGRATISGRPARGGTALSTLGRRPCDTCASTGAVGGVDGVEGLGRLGDPAAVDEMAEAAAVASSQARASPFGFGARAVVHGVEDFLDGHVVNVGLAAGSLRGCAHDQAQVKILRGEPRRGEGQACAVGPGRSPIAWRWPAE